MYRFGHRTPCQPRSTLCCIATLEWLSDHRVALTHTAQVCGGDQASGTLMEEIENGLPFGSVAALLGISCDSTALAQKKGGGRPVDAIKVGSG